MLKYGFYGGIILFNFRTSKKIEKNLKNNFFKLIKLRDSHIQLLEEQVEIQSKLIELYQKKLNDHGIKL